MTIESECALAWQELGMGMGFSPLGAAMLLGHAPDAAECLAGSVLPEGAGHLFELREYGNRLGLTLPARPPLAELGFGPDQAGDRAQLPARPMLVRVGKQRLARHQANVRRHLP